MPKIAVCDDNPLHVKHTAALVQDALPGAETDLVIYTDAAAFRTAIEAGELKPDIAVLDIEMEGIDGIRIAELINRVVPGCQIIFLSGHADFASEVYTTRHVWFVTKNRADEYLKPALHRAMDNLSERQPQAGLTFRTDGRTVVLPLREVLYIERVGRRSRVVARSSEYLSAQPPVLLLGTAASAFLRCHQGYWVRLNRVISLDHTEFVMENGDRIPISRTFRDAARTAFFDLHRL
ncbi:MAG: response regulator transcription factor [Clostridia bacterium]|nr:response regulator transcription factor [Clostridia bacterium]